MLAMNNKNVSACVLFASALCLFLIVGKNWNKLHILIGDLTEKRQDDSSILSQIFVPTEKQYNAKEGIVYDCLTKEVHSKVAPVNHTCIFKSTANVGEDPMARAKSFRDIFEKQTWVKPAGKTPSLQKSSSEFRSSGWGSTLVETKFTTPLLNAIVDRLKLVLGKPVISIVDVPCGDFYWMRHFVGNRTDVQYTGIDIVPALIQRHRIHYENMTNARFEHRDIVTDGLHQSYDVIFCRELLQHLKNADVLKVLEHFSKSGSKLLVATNHIWNKSATEVSVSRGRYRELNLMLPPVNLIPPICSTRDGASQIFRELAIWTLPLKQRK